SPDLPTSSSLAPFLKQQDFVVRPDPALSMTRLGRKCARVVDIKKKKNRLVSVTFARASQEIFVSKTFPEILRPSSLISYTCSPAIVLFLRRESQTDSPTVIGVNPIIKRTSGT